MSRGTIPRLAETKFLSTQPCGINPWLAAVKGCRYNLGMTEDHQTDRLARTLILVGALLMLVPCLLAVAALIIFGWPLFVRP